MTEADAPAAGAGAADDAPAEDTPAADERATAADGRARASRPVYWSDDETAPGARLVAVNRWLTLAFAAWSVLAVLVRPLRIPLAGLDLVVFIAGCIGYLLAYATAVSRSRADAIGLGALFFLIEDAAPRPVRRSFWLWTSVQTVVAVAAAAVRPFTPVAFGILVPLAGLALMGLWGARYGRFPARFPDPRPAAPGGPTSDEPAPSTRDEAEMEQNDRHG